jgi:cytochrome c-type biogenesis protein CcmH/NrfG
VPRELAIRCRKMIESHHAKEGYAHLSDMLWRSNARHIIERSHALKQIFKSASKSKYAKRSYERLLYLATVVVSLEVLARNFMDWGQQYPAARHEAEKILSEPLIHRLPWLMDVILISDVRHPSAVAKMLELPES